MKILIDTNVLVSAALNPNGVPAAAYKKAAYSTALQSVDRQSAEKMDAYLRDNN